MVAVIKLEKIIVSDVLIFGFVYLIPTISHLLSFPLYLLDPMRLAVLGSVIFMSDKRNAYLLALSLPIFSYFVGGHPVAWKSVLIGIELVTNLYVLSLLEKKIGYSFLAIFLSIVASKLVYYTMKYGCITIGVLDGRLLTTDILWQIGVAILISVVYVYVRKRERL